MSALLDSEGWFRCGRGMGLDFPATDDNIVDLLETSLHGIGTSNFYIIASFFIKEGKNYIPSFKKIEPKEILDCNKEGIWCFFIGDDNLTPYTELEQMSGNIDRIAGCNGLINLQYGSKNKSGRETPSIGLVNRIENLNTMEVIEHTEYVRIFKQLVKNIKKYNKQANASQKP
jgi:hypothetical protein